MGHGPDAVDDRVQRTVLPVPAVEIHRAAPGTGHREIGSGRFAVERGPPGVQELGRDDPPPTRTEKSELIGLEEIHFRGFDGTERRALARRQVDADGAGPDHHERRVAGLQVAAVLIAEVGVVTDHGRVAVDGHQLHLTVEGILVHVGPGQFGGLFVTDHRSVARS
ncbi:hypothetical protein ACIRD0_16550 [Streptomyces microflavus]|uniref:hypothetical protein n=1 Tax=Streptomyces microflavus TaxID=1919 RepID=UPI003804DD26